MHRLTAHYGLPCGFYGITVLRRCCILDYIYKSTRDYTSSDPHRRYIIINKSEQTVNLHRVFFLIVIYTPHTHTHTFCVHKALNLCVRRGCGARLIADRRKWLCASDLREIETPLCNYVYATSRNAGNLIFFFLLILIQLGSKGH